MSDSVIKKLKKYVLYISAIFFVILGSHLLYYYIYDGASSEAIEWGTVSEAIIWSFPHFNPLVLSNDHNSYINGLLYRSMMEYSTVSESFRPDLVSCNTDNLLYIQCTLENNILWSDGNDITTEDIKATLSLIKETKVNPIISSLLENTTIETTKDTISFSNESKDINFLQIFLQPILSKWVVERLDTNNINGKFSEINGVYSGRFLLSSISQDETVGVTKITLWKNENYFWNDMYINFLILNLFRDESHFLRNKNSFNLFNDKSGIIGTSIPRLSVQEYTLAQFVGSFFNSEKIPLDFRTFISTTLDRENIIESVGSANVVPAYNPFLSDIQIDPKPNNFNLKEYIESKWYYRKQELLESALTLEEEKKKQQELISQEAVIQKQQEEIIQQETLKYVTSPYSDKYNFISKDNVLIQWNVDSGVDAVYINDYRLEGFDPGDNVFFYRLLESFDSISPWENRYKVYFEINGKREFKEEFVYIYNTDAQELSETINTFFTDKKEILSLPKEISQSDATIDTNLSSGELSNLDNSYYYNADGEAFTLKFVYARSDENMEKTVAAIQNLLQAEWIQLEIEALDLGDITLKLRNDALDYDMIVLGINLGYFDSNIFPYFHSSQAENGYNLWNYKKLSLDILLEELKSNNLSITKREELEIKLLDILSKESIIKVFYTPKINLLVDKNIKSFELPNFLPDSKHRYFPLLESYLSEKRIINKEWKWVFDFFRYLIAQLFS